MSALINSPVDMSEAEFISEFGGLYEHSAWIAGAVFEAGLNTNHDQAENLHRAFCRVIESANRQQQLELLRAHPDLAGKLARADKLTDSSRSEQAGAGLDQCTQEEFSAFTELNNNYKAKFGFPFIMAVKGADRAQILLQFQHRVDNSPESEFETALQHVLKIGRFRLTEILND